MPYCAKCGTDLQQSRFCANCGTSADVPQPPPPPPPQAATSTPDIPENVVCALTYALGALSAVLFLVLEPYSKNPRVRFHAFQSLFVSVAVFVLWFALLIMSGMLVFLPYVGAAMGSAVLALFGLAWLGLWIVLMLKAYQGERWKLPVIGDFAEKQSYTN